MNHSPFSFRNLGPGVKWLLASNVCLFIIQQVIPGALEANFGLVPAMVLGHVHVWRLFTYLFLHGSFFHILINMFTLWMFGKELEFAWGTKEFLKFFFLCGLGASLLNIVLDPFSTVPVIGASGSIYGLLVAFALVFPDSVIYLYGIIPMRAKQFVFLLGVMEFLASWRSNSDIAHFAHLGGMLTGIVYLKSYEFRSFCSRSLRKISDFFVVRKPEDREDGGEYGTEYRGESRKDDMKADDLVKEVDRILEKVLTKGADSLTEKEREIMRLYSSKKH